MDKPHRLLAEALAHGQSHDQGWRVRKDGSRFWANVMITPLFEGEDHVGFAKVTHDETERRATEERIRELELIADRERIAG